MMRAHVDVRATVLYICKALSKLDTKMSPLDSNKTKFNVYIKAQVIALDARGETTDDPLVNVFKGYQMAQDADLFCKFNKRKKDAYDEGMEIIALSSWKWLKTSTRLIFSLENGAHPPRNRSRSLPLWHRSNKSMMLPLLLLLRTSRISLSPNI
jgi:hypothetical protein